MDIDSQRKRAAILRVIADAGGPVGSSKIAEELGLQGIDLKERMVRNYLEVCDRLGFTENLGRHGRMITPLGQQELRSAVAVDRVGFVSANVDELSYKTTFDLASLAGKVILNTSTIPRAEVDRARTVIKTVMAAGLGMGRLLFIDPDDPDDPDERDDDGGDLPDGRVTLGTVCGITLNGVFRGNGVPITANFGGLLQIKSGVPVRFTEIIHYNGTTLDPIEIFIKGKMTRVFEAAKTGTGTIGASFREFPAAALPRAKELIADLERVGLCTVLLLGEAGRPLLDVPVHPGRVGAVVAAGLNPIAAIEEHGIPTENDAMSVLKEFQTLVPAF
jgi:HTH-type transcriptional regulator, global nitrogen regulator NrpRI